MKKFVLLGLLFAVVGLALCLSSKSTVKPEVSTPTTNVVERAEVVSPDTGSVTTEQSSVSTEPSADTGGSRRITFTVSPRLGSGTNGQ